MYDRRPASTAWSIAFAPAPKPEAATLGSFQFAIVILHHRPAHTGRTCQYRGFPLLFQAKPDKGNIIAPSTIRGRDGPPPRLSPPPCPRPACLSRCPRRDRSVKY